MDILFFAAVALLIFLKLGKQLGRVDEEEKKMMDAKIAKQKEQIEAIQGKIIQKITEISEEQKQAEEKILGDLDATTRASFSDILQRCNISAQFFVNGAKSVFEMTLKAFAANDLEALKPLLSDNVFAGFEGAINERKLLSQTLTTNLIAINKAEILSAGMFENFALVVVKISSRQINYISDVSGQIVVGKKDEINELSDVWTFKKDVTSANPSWVVSNTAS
ncbi:MAG: Tim44/TimA family putative adaptor protein [Rickettsiales bacterium]|nr:Tim44/TimA family putative adaptor protein [Rickettsiales bacterium]